VFAAAIVPEITLLPVVVVDISVLPDEVYNFTEMLLLAEFPSLYIFLNPTVAEPGLAAETNMYKGTDVPASLRVI
jgi:hypothetical protein